MNKVDIENILRPMYKNLGIVGGRGPVPSFIVYATIVSVILLTFILILLINIYDSMTTGKCIMCGQSHKNCKHIVHGISIKNDYRRTKIISRFAQ